MKRAAVALAFVLAACASGPRLPAPNTAETRYEPQLRSVRVLVSALAPASAADLLAPSGDRYPAAAVTLLRGPFVAYNPPPSVSLGIGGFGFGGCCTAFGSGIGVGLPVGRPTPAAVSDQYISSAVIRVPEDYMQHWSNYRVQVRVGDRALSFYPPLRRRRAERKAAGVEHAQNSDRIGQNGRTAEGAGGRRFGRGHEICARVARRGGLI